MTLVSCAACERPILDKFIFNVLDRSWHQNCIQCIDCGLNLNDKCFSRDGKLFCKDDFYRRYGPKCSGCSQGISPTDFVRRARDKVFHLKCFTCCICRKQLSTGDQLYVVDDNKFMCKQDYIQNKIKEELDDDTIIKSPDIYQNNHHHHHHHHHQQHHHHPSNRSLISQKLTQSSNNCNNNNINDNKNVTIELKQELNDTNNKHNGSNNGILNDSNEYYKNQTASQSTATITPTTSTNSNIQNINNNNNINLDVAAEKENLLINSSTGSSDLYDGNSKDANDTDNLIDENDYIDSDKDDDDDSDIGEDHIGLNGKHSSSSSSKDDNNNNSNGKKRGPRTTIKAKQLEMLKSAFANTPKPTRHIREQLAQDTGLNMRVIQVWFQNRRSKERRMKQLSALGNRRHYYRNAARVQIDAGQNSTNNNTTNNNSNNNNLNSNTNNLQNRQIPDIGTTRARFDLVNENNDLVGQNIGMNYMHTGEFYSQNSFNEFMIQNENQLQRINYTTPEHSLVNQEMNFGINHDVIANSSSPDEIDHFNSTHSVSLTQSYSASTGPQIQTLNTQTHELDTVW